MYGVRYEWVHSDWVSARACDAVCESRTGPASGSTLMKSVSAQFTPTACTRQKGNRNAPRPLLRSRATHRHSVVPCANAGGDEVRTMSDAHTSTSTSRKQKQQVSRKETQSVGKQQAHRRAPRTAHRQSCASEQRELANLLCRVTVLSVHRRHRVVLCSV